MGVFQQKNLEKKETISTAKSVMAARVFHLFHTIVIDVFWWVSVYSTFLFTYFSSRAEPSQAEQAIESGNQHFIIQCKKAM